MIINFCVSNAVTIVFVLELVLVINSESTVNVQVAQVWHFVVSIGLYLCLFLFRCRCWFWCFLGQWFVSLFLFWCFGEELWICIFALFFLIVLASINFFTIIFGIDGKLVHQIIIHLKIVLVANFFIFDQPHSEILLLYSVWLDYSHSSVGSWII